MDKKKMYLANLNVTFGKDDEPLLKWIDEFVYPALQMDYKRKINNKTKVMFENVSIEMIEDEYVLKGIIIKDTILDILNEYDEKKGLIDVNSQAKSAPYSAFMIFLKNHRMVLVRNQSGSPDLRLFASSFSQTLKNYRTVQNKIRKEEGTDQLPDYTVTVRGIASRASVEEMMEKVKKVKKLTFIMKPRNNENGGLYNLLDGLDEEIRKKSQSKLAKYTIVNPESKTAVTQMISETEGLIETELEVEYKNEVLDEDTNKLKKFGKIKDNEVSQVVDINIKKELRDSFETIKHHCNNIPQLHVVNKDNLIDYSVFKKKRMDLGEWE